MKNWLTVASALLFICLASIITNAVGNKQINRFPSRDYESNVEIRRDLHRTFNSTRILKSAKLGNHNFKDTVRHSSLRVEHFQTRVNHFSADDQRTVEFVRISKEFLLTELKRFYQTAICPERWVFHWKWANIYLCQRWWHFHHTFSTDWTDAWHCNWIKCRFGHGWYEIFSK